VLPANSTPIMAATTHIAVVPPSSIFRRVNVEWSLAVIEVARRSDIAGQTPSSRPRSGHQNTSTLRSLPNICSETEASIARWFLET
jgi:hypothetical protein